MTATVNKAPKGGLVSVVNGHRYEGGQFTPYHGLYCGKVGQKRQQKAEAASLRGRLYEVGGRMMFEALEYAGSGVWNILGVIVADCQQDAEAFARTLTAKSIDLRKV